MYKFINLFTHGKKVRTHLMKRDSEDLQLLMKWVAEGKLRLCIDKEYKLEDISKAHAYMEEGHTEGKILIRYDWITDNHMISRWQKKESIKNFFNIVLFLM